MEPHLTDTPTVDTHVELLGVAGTVGQAAISEFSNLIIESPTKRANELDVLADRVENRLQDIKDNELMSEEQKQQAMTDIYRDAEQQRDLINKKYQDASFGRAILNIGKILQQELTAIAIKQAAEQATQVATRAFAGGAGFFSGLGAAGAAGAGALLSNPIGLIALLGGVGIGLYQAHQSGQKAKEAERRLINTQRTFDYPTNDMLLERRVVEAIGGQTGARRFDSANRKSAEDEVNIITSAINQSVMKADKSGGTGLTKGDIKSAVQEGLSEAFKQMPPQIIELDNNINMNDELLVAMERRKIILQGQRKIPGPPALQAANLAR